MILFNPILINAPDYIEIQCVCLGVGRLVFLSRHFLHDEAELGGDARGRVEVEETEAAGFAAALAAGLTVDLAAGAAVK